jgi:hypothetical protein
VGETRTRGDEPGSDGSTTILAPDPLLPRRQHKRVWAGKAPDLVQIRTQERLSPPLLTHVHVWRMTAILVPVVLSRAQNRTCSLSNLTTWNPTCTVVPLAVTTVAFHPDVGVADVTLSVVVVS